MALYTLLEYANSAAGWMHGCDGVHGVHGAQIICACSCVMLTSRRLSLASTMLLTCMPAALLHAARLEYNTDARWGSKSASTSLMAAVNSFAASSYRPVGTHEWKRPDHFRSILTPRKL